MTEIKELLRTSMEEFESMQKEEGWNYELIDGMVMMSPRPAAKHQRINGNIYHELRKLLIRKKLRAYSGNRSGIAWRKFYSRFNGNLS